MDKQKLSRRYRSLWLGETVSILLFIYLFAFFAARDAGWHNWILRGYSLAVVIIILLQGVSWWRWKQHQLAKDTRDMPAHIVTRFHRLRTVNWLLIAAFPLAMLGKRVITGALTTSADLWLGLLILAFAALEQINYYYVQLMYDSRYDWNYLRTHRSLRRGTIGKVLDRQLP